MGAIDLFSIEGKTALVTGASYGLGARFASILAEAGCNVVLAARSVDKLEAVAHAIDPSGDRSLAHGCDVSVPEQVQATVDAAWRRFGRVDILVNNAGVIAEAGIMPERIPDALFAQTMMTNVNGVFTFCREVGARQLADGKGGSHINVASVAGLGASSHFPTAYQTSKAAVINLSKNLAVSWASRGVRVNTLCPGWFPSEMTTPFFGLPPFWDRVLAMSPMGRVGKEHELDGALLFLASDASSFMTGAEVVVDGGISSHLGGVDYTPELFEAMTQVAGEFGTRIMPAAG
jgi:NAD(P)-dependent dehydrogenase (short-subunit alcohol dehydrogenase family)